MSTRVVLVRHGEIVRPPYTSNFDRAPLSDRGEQQIRALTKAWPAGRPAALYASPLRRAIESAIIFGEAFQLKLLKRAGLKEWTPDDSGIPQEEYKALERGCWADLDFVPASKESLVQATVRGRRCIEEIAAAAEGKEAALVGHGTLFALVVADLKGERPTEEYKESIGFGYAAIIEAGSDLRLISDFRPYGNRPA